MSYTKSEQEKCICGDIRLAHTEVEKECIYCNCKRFKLKDLVEKENGNGK